MKNSSVYTEEQIVKASCAIAQYLETMDLTIEVAEKALKGARKIIFASSKVNFKETIYEQTDFLKE